MVGGGIAGLTVAAALDPSRFEVTVFEAAPERAGVGSALAMWPSARRALASVGALDTVERAGWRVGGGSLRDLSGRTLAQVDSVDLLMIARAELLAALDAAVSGEVRRVHQAVTDPAALDADLVIGADGVRSVVRGLVEPRRAARRETPWIALRGLAPEPPALDEIGEYWGPGRLFGIAPVRSGGCYWFSTHPSTLGPEPLDPTKVIEEARIVFAGTAPAIAARLAAAGPEALATRLWVAPPMTRYVAGCYVVIGDAAHGMTPNLGRGACEAIVDGVSLARTLNDGGRLLAWQAKRVPATQTARLVSGLMMRQAVSARVQPVRDRLLRTLRGRGQP